MNSEAPEVKVPASPQQEPRVLRWLSALEMGLGVFFIAVMMITVLWQVLGRYVPQASWVGAGEIARFSPSSRSSPTS